MAPKLLLAICVLLISGQGVSAQTLMYEDFQDGNSDGWRGFGEGVIGITEYKGNASLQMTKGSVVARQIELKNASRIRIGAAFAATELSHDGACIAEVTLDEGSNWTDVVRVVSGQDDSLTQHSGAVSREVVVGKTHVWIRARVAGKSASARCWLDNVYVVGERLKKTSLEKAPARQLSREFLLGNQDLAEPILMNEYVQPPDATSPLHGFSGSLKLDDVAYSGHINIVVDHFDRQADIGERMAHLPEFDFEFVLKGFDLIPLQRGVQRREHPYWEIILQPGKAWNEAGDDGWTRAAVPFSLQERSASCIHNGVLSWLFNAVEVSRVVYQISSETCGYLKFDLWGVVAARYLEEDLAKASIPHFERLETHRSRRLPIHRLSELARDYPGVEPLSFGVDDGIHPDDISVLGVVVDGNHYRSDCNTRQGPYPFCDSMPLPSYSTAKSIFAALATMRMERLFPGSSKAPIAKLVDSCGSKRWRGVSVENALDMATGNYRSKEPNIDEDSEPSLKFIFEDTHKTKTDFACKHYKRKSSPGSRFVYHTSDTYLVGVALGRLLRQHTNSKNMYRDLLVDPLWRHLELSPLLDETMRTYDDEAQPFAGYGLTYEADDIARIANWLSVHNGVIDDRITLDPSMFNAAMQRTENDRGLDTGFPDTKYNNGFWAFNAGPSLGCKNSVWVPFMSGVMGITVAMFPNGVTYYYFSDSYVFKWQSARVAAHLIKDMCQ